MNDDIIYTLLTPRYSSTILEAIIIDALNEHHEIFPLTINIDTVEAEITECASCSLFNMRNRSSRGKVDEHYKQVISQEFF